MAAAAPAPLDPNAGAHAAVAAQAAAGAGGARPVDVGFDAARGGYYAAITDSRGNVHSFSAEMDGQKVHQQAQGANHNAMIEQLRKMAEVMRDLQNTKIANEGQQTAFNLSNYKFERTTVGQNQAKITGEQIAGQGAGQNIEVGQFAITPAQLQATATIYESCRAARLAAAGGAAAGVGAERKDKKAAAEEKEIKAEADHSQVYKSLRKEKEEIAQTIMKMKEMKLHSPAQINAFTKSQTELFNKKVSDSLGDSSINADESSSLQITDRSPLIESSACYMKKAIEKDKADIDKTLKSPLFGDRTGKNFINWKDNLEDLEASLKTRADRIKNSNIEPNNKRQLLNENNIQLARVLDQQTINSSKLSMKYSNERYENGEHIADDLDKNQTLGQLRASLVAERTELNALNETIQKSDVSNEVQSYGVFNTNTRISLIQHRLDLNAAALENLDKADAAAASKAQQSAKKTSSWVSEMHERFRFSKPLDQLIPKPLYQTSITSDKKAETEMTPTKYNMHAFTPVASTAAAAAAAAATTGSPDKSSKSTRPGFFQNLINKMTSCFKAQSKNIARTSSFSTIAMADWESSKSPITHNNSVSVISTSSQQSQNTSGPLQSQMDKKHSIAGQPPPPPPLQSQSSMSSIDIELGQTPNNPNSVDAALKDKEAQTIPKPNVPNSGNSSNDNS